MKSSNSGQGRNVLEIGAPLANSAIVSTLTVHGRWEDETTREWTASVLAIKGLRDCSSYSYSYLIDTISFYDAFP